jgi:hypothetical protein
MIHPLRILSKDMFAGILLNSVPQVSIKPRQDGAPQVEQFWLIASKNREAMYLDFADKHGLKFTTWKINGSNYIRIQDRTTLRFLLKMIPQWIIDADQRLVSFCKIMKIIHSKKHLTEDGLNEIKLLRNEMMKKKGLEW